MRGLGLGALSHANWHAVTLSFENRYWPELSVLQAAHAAEILIKARIAEEHPLLIFDDLPKRKTVEHRELEHADLYLNGKTFQFSELPDRLWATTGISISNIVAYKEFGRLRNSIQHFSAPKGVDCSLEAIKFVFEVVDPFIKECWNLYALDYTEDYDTYQYFAEYLVERSIEFSISPNFVKYGKDVKFEWDIKKPEYRIEMERRIAEAAMTFS